MTVRKTLVAACIAATGIAVAAGVASAEPDNTYTIGNVLYFGSGPGQEAYGAFCYIGPEDPSGNFPYGQGYYEGWISPTNQDGDFQDHQGSASCPDAKDPSEAPGDAVENPPVDPNNPPDPNDPPGLDDLPNPGNGLPNGYAAFNDPSKSFLGDGGGIVVGNNPGGRGYELGVCQQNASAPKGYVYGSLSTTKGPDGGTTESCPAHKPLVKGRPATSVTSTSARLNAVINGNYMATTYYYEIGTDTSYGSRSDVLDLRTYDRDVSLSLSIGGGTPNTTYHYRYVAKNHAGTTVGPDVTFTTAP